MHKLAKKKSMMNFSQSHPIRHLEKREELLVAGTAMELMEDEAQCEMLLDLAGRPVAVPYTGGAVMIKILFICHGKI